MTTRRIVASSLAGLALVALSACQGTATTSSSSPMGSASTAASSSSTASSSASSTSSSASPSKAASGSASSSASGSAAMTEAKDANDLADKVSAAMKATKTYKVDLQAGGGTSGGGVAASTSMVIDQTDPNNLKAQGTAAAGPVTVEMIIIGSDTYVKQPSGKYKKAAITEQDKDMLMQGVGDQFRKASAFKKVGAETVDGVQAMHYQVVIPANAVAAGSPETPMEVWIDAKNRLVKQETTTEASGVKGTATVKISDFDKPATITAPAADQIEG